MNGSQGITPTIELATNGNNSGFYPYPIYPMMGGFGGNGGGIGRRFVGKTSFLKEPLS